MSPSLFLQARRVGLKMARAIARPKTHIARVDAWRNFHHCKYRFSLYHKILSQIGAIAN